MINMETLREDHIEKVVRGFDGFDKIMTEVIATTEDNRKKIRRRLEDYLRKCKPEKLALVVALCGISTEIVPPRVKGDHNEDLK